MLTVYAGPPREANPGRPWNGRRTEERPSLLIPNHPGDLAAHYDLTISHPSPDLTAFRAFDQWLAQAAAVRGLSCALLHDGVVHEAIRRLDQGRLKIGFHLDYFALWHVAGDAYARLAEAVQDAGGSPVNSPAQSRRFTDKATAHAELLRHGFGVPETIIVGPAPAERPLTAAERIRLGLTEPGARVYIKPANGFGGRGVVAVAGHEENALAAALGAARNADPQDAVLIQRAVSCPRLKCDDGVERPAYWRVLYCLGELHAFWWSRQELDHGRPCYYPMTPAERTYYRLEPVLSFVQDLAALTGLEWFSTELCLSEGAEASRYRVRGADGRERPVVAIDYVNDQCDVDVQSRWLGAPPDAVVRHLAERFAEAAWQCCQILPLPARPVVALRPAA
jgi:hypothetical protein